MDRAWSTCVPKNTNHTDGIVRSWRGINSSLSYLCNHAKKGNQTLATCLHLSHSVWSRPRVAVNTYKLSEWIYFRWTKRILHTFLSEANRGLGSSQQRGRGGVTFLHLFRRNNFFHQPVGNCKLKLCKNRCCCICLFHICVQV